jgi:hypothetical protein
MLYSGIVAAAIWNANPFRKEGSPPVSPLDFVPDEKRDRGPQTLDEQVRFLTEVMGCGPGKPTIN